MAVEQLEQLLNQVPRLKNLANNPKNAEFQQWDSKVTDILTQTFGRRSKEYARYEGSSNLKFVNTYDEMRTAYIDTISQREKALKDIIQQHKHAVEDEKAKKTTSKFPWLLLQPNFYGLGLDLKKLHILKRWFHKD